MNLTLSQNNLLKRFADFLERDGADYNPDPVLVDHLRTNADEGGYCFGFVLTWAINPKEYEEGLLELSAWKKERWNEELQRINRMPDGEEKAQLQEKRLMREKRFEALLNGIVFNQGHLPSAFHLETQTAHQTLAKIQDALTQADTGLLEFVDKDGNVKTVKKRETLKVHSDLANWESIAEYLDTNLENGQAVILGVRTRYDLENIDHAVGIKKTENGLAFLDPNDQDGPQTVETHTSLAEKIANSYVSNTDVLMRIIGFSESPRQMLAPGIEALCEKNKQKALQDLMQAIEPELNSVQKLEDVVALVDKFKCPEHLNLAFKLAVFAKMETKFSKAPVGQTPHPHVSGVSFFKPAPDTGSTSRQDAKKDKDDFFKTSEPK